MCVCVCVCVSVGRVQRKKHKLQNKKAQTTKRKTIGGELNPLTGTQNYC